MNKILKPLGIALIAGASIYTGIQFTANTVVDELLVGRNIEAVEEFLGGSLTYQQAGVDAKFSPVINQIEISDLGVIPGAKVSIGSLTINQMTGLNFNIDLKKVALLVDAKNFNDNQGLVDLLAKGADITLINQCEDDRCDLTAEVKVAGMASLKVDLSTSNVKSIAEALSKIDLKVSQDEGFHGALKKEFEESAAFVKFTIQEFSNLYKSVQKEENIFHDADVKAAMNERAGDVRRNTLFTALNEKYDREAPKKEIKDFLILVNELAKADLSIKAKISKPKDIQNNLSILMKEAKFSAEEVKISKIFTDRFKGIGVSFSKQSDVLAADFSFSGYETNYGLSASVSAPTIVEVAQIKDQGSYDRVVSKISAGLKTNSSSTGFGLTAEEITILVDIVSGIGLPMANRDGLEKWLFENIDKMTSFNGDTDLNFSLKAREVAMKASGQSQMLDYEFSDRYIFPESNPESMVPTDFHLDLRVKELMDVIYSGIQVIAGEEAYQEVITQRDNAVSKERLSIWLGELKENSKVDASKFFASMGIKDNEELAKAGEAFAKNPGLLKIDLSIPDGESNPFSEMLSVFIAKEKAHPAKTKNPIQGLDKYLSIEIAPK